MRDLVRMLRYIHSRRASRPASGNAQDFRMPPPLPGPYSYGIGGCPSGYVSIAGDVCEPYFPLMRTWPRMMNSYRRAGPKAVTLHQASRRRRLPPKRDTRPLSIVREGHFINAGATRPHSFYRDRTVSF